MKKSLAFLAALAAATALAATAHAKTWTAGKYSCEDERQVGARQGAPAPVKVGTVSVIGPDNVGQCLGKCDANAQCHTVNIRHVNPTPNDATTCTLYSNKTVQKTVYKSIQGKQYGAVCSKP
jgi:hypothetical protein